MILIADEALLRDCPSWLDWFDELVDLIGDGSWCGRLSGELRFVVEREQIRFGGRLEGQVPRECDRCLGHFLEPVRLDLAEVCHVSAEGGPEAWFDDETEVWRVGLGGRVRVTELVRQATLLTLATRAVCGPACPAGENLGRRPAEPGGDPRLAVLRHWLATEKDDGSPEEENE